LGQSFEKPFDIGTGFNSQSRLQLLAQWAQTLDPIKVEMKMMFLDDIHQA
jgi:hypothetical protein